MARLASFAHVVRRASRFDQINPIPMGRKSFQNLPALNNDVDRLVRDLERETDRGAALLGAAFLDDVLDVMLRTSFVNDDEAVNKLVGPGRPLESFGSRAHLAYCMGLLGADIYADINLIREIRNDFAHRHPTTFDVKEIREKCERLRCVGVMMPPGEHPCSGRERFTVDVVLIANHLMVLTAQMPHAPVAKSYSENGVLRLR